MAGGFHDTGGRTEERLNVGGAAHRDDAIAAHGEGSGLWLGGIHGAQVAVEDDEVRGGRRRGEAAGQGRRRQQGYRKE